VLHALEQAPKDVGYRSLSEKIHVCVLTPHRRALAANAMEGKSLPKFVALFFFISWRRRHAVHITFVAFTCPTIFSVIFHCLIAGGARAVLYQAWYR
jgi:hypothetical protein